MDTPNMNTGPQDNAQAPAQNVAPTNSAAVFDEKGGVGPVVGIIIVVVLLVIGGVYYYMQMQGGTSETAPVVEQQAAPVSDALPALPPDTATQALKTQGTSNNVSAIEADLNKTDLTNLSSDLTAVVGGAGQ